MSDRVPLPDWQTAVHLNMNISQEHQPASPDPQDIDSFNAWHSLRELSDSRVNIFGGGDIEHVPDG